LRSLGALVFRRRSENHFRDHAGLLIAIAAEGFYALKRALSWTPESAPQRVDVRGRAYVDFGLTPRRYSP
jgi:hypothetical protein